MEDVKTSAAEEWEHEGFDLEAVYDEKISPLMKEIIAICKEHQIPMVAAFVYKIENEPGEESQPMLSTTSLPFDNRTPNTIKKAGLVLKRGWDVCPPFYTTTVVTSE